ncbi:hypothetical protein M409DRAFT_19130 [Zasmidium cellare ATCC 36951]|uniref:tRNA-splicing endonuclease subunit Sen2 n=1 Tax=Zasmidium cellare ATCC 36951 TaxID=1080233 RepID=A0A6A6CZB9_ZASCE|nr:uncharacterized protein M409DRAFT_19130 [Zasmidium cellare ATCC 36951]KAF2171159.1 hypothetical protein M409DRAFT_19130 [Zasmidium cellare ATCC 36951]
MAEVASTNGHIPENVKVDSATNSANGTPVKPNHAGAPKRRPKKKGPNYGEIHKYPLPLTTHPLPAFHPTNPISLLRLAYTYISQLIGPPASHPAVRYIGCYSQETRSIHVTDPQHVRALWEMGFFGKGTLSRSEPSWLEREKARVRLKHGGGTAEEATNARRERRRLFKLERARAEAEKIERQRLVEEGKLDPPEVETTALDTTTTTPVLVEAQTNQPTAINIQELDRPDSASISDEDEELEINAIENQEHLQLTMEEAFFLSYGLGVLDIRWEREGNPSAQDMPQLLRAFIAHGHFPQREVSSSFQPDDTFLLKYVVYHHFRSLGWVVRPGVKFSVDYLLYFRGPVFSHAEFAVMIVPSYTHPYWSTAEGSERRRIKEPDQKDWWWLHCVNRVQSQVLKTLVLVYVDVPPPVEQRDEDIGGLLRGYKVREFVIRRWIANRSRD